MKIAMTGASGFIGAWLWRELEEAGHLVVGIDRHGDGQRIERGDLTEPDVAKSWLQNEQPDVCVHLAAQVGRAFGDRDLSHTVRSNAEMTTLVAHACGELNIRLAYTSTSEVYGDQRHAVCHEDDGPFSLPHNLYGLSKLWGESVCRLYAPMGLVIWRPSMPYGPGAPPGHGRRALDNMLWQAYHGMEIPVHRGAERSWCWIGDTVRGMRYTIERPDAGAYNVGRDDDPRTMLEIAKEAVALAGADPGLIRVVDPPKAQTVVKRLSTAKLRNLGWKPTVELHEGIVQVWDWVRQFDEQGVKAA